MKFDLFVSAVAAVAVSAASATWILASVAREAAPWENAAYSRINSNAAASTVDDRAATSLRTSALPVGQGPERVSDSVVIARRR